MRRSCKPKILTKEASFPKQYLLSVSEFLSKSFFQIPEDQLIRKSSKTRQKVRGHQPTNGKCVPEIDDSDADICYHMTFRKKIKNLILIKGRLNRTNTVPGRLRCKQCGHPWGLRPGRGLAIGD